LLALFHTQKRIHNGPPDIAARAQDSGLERREAPEESNIARYKWLRAAQQLGAV